MAATTDINGPARSLFNKLAWVLLIKLLLLVILWWAFVRDARHVVDARALTERMFPTVSQSAEGATHDF